LEFKPAIEMLLFLRNLTVHSDAQLPVREAVQAQVPFQLPPEARVRADFLLSDLSEKLHAEVNPLPPSPADAPSGSNEPPVHSTTTLVLLDL
jgi:hypothetical protein